MTINRELLEEYKQLLSDRYTAAELVELLELDIWDILEQFEEEIIVLRSR